MQEAAACLLERTFLSSTRMVCNVAGNSSYAAQCLFNYPTSRPLQDKKPFGPSSLP